MSNYEYLERKATIYSLRGFFNALGNSPWTIIHKDGPSLPRVGRLGFGGNVTMKDGSTGQVVLDESGLNPGERVIVYTQGIVD